MLLLQLQDGSLDVLHTSSFSHLLGGEVGVATGSVPVSVLDDLGVEGDLDSPLLGASDEKESSHPEVVAHVDTLARSDLAIDA